jgi:hypothetical protein
MPFTEIGNMRTSLWNLIVAIQHGALRSSLSIHLQNLTAIKQNSQPKSIPESTPYKNRDILALQLPPALNLNKLGSVGITQLYGIFRLSIISSAQNIFFLISPFPSNSDTIEEAARVLVDMREYLCA